MKPNIFDISTKELSQDAFISWLLQWADSNANPYDPNLNRCGVDFAKELIRKVYPDFNDPIESVRTFRQKENIDVWAEVNGKYLIIIEDKTFTGQHSGQLSKYIAFAEKWCNKENPKFFPPICIYLKTGNESHDSLKHVLNEGYKVYSRQEFIALLQRHKLKNDIYNDFKSRLIRMELSYSEWDKRDIHEWSGNDWQGFFQFLEHSIHVVKWRFVNNPNRGFWAAMLNWDYWGSYPVYLQIEEQDLCFKVSTNPKDGIESSRNEKRGEVRNKLSRLILDSAKEKGITTIRRPNRFGNGNYMTVAIVDCENWLGVKTEKVIKEQVTEKLLFFKHFLLDTINKAP